MCGPRHILNHLVCVPQSWGGMKLLETIHFNVSGTGSVVIESQWVPRFRGHTADAQSPRRAKPSNTGVSDSCHSCYPIITVDPSALGSHLLSWWHNCISSVIVNDPNQSHLVSWRLPASRSTHMLSQSRLVIITHADHSRWESNRHLFLTVYSPSIYISTNLGLLRFQKHCPPGHCADSTAGCCYNLFSQEDLRYTF